MKAGLIHPFRLCLRLWGHSGNSSLRSSGSGSYAVIVLPADLVWKLEHFVILYCSCSWPPITAVTTVKYCSAAIITTIFRAGVASDNAVAVLRNAYGSEFPKKKERLHSIRGVSLSAEAILALPLERPVQSCAVIQDTCR